MKKAGSPDRPVPATPLPSAKDSLQELAAEEFLTIETSTARLALDLTVGHIRDLVFHDAENEIRPLHTAPWVHEDPAGLPEHLPPVERRLSGDFLCAPFGASDVEEAPLHGWSANSAWVAEEVVCDDDKAYAKLRLEKQILGATLEKEVLLVAGAPFLYQTHKFIGGEGKLPVAHHVMTRVEAGGMLCHSLIDHAWTHKESLDPNLNLLAYPAESNDLAAFPREEGGIANLGEFPLAGGYEDFLTLVEGKRNTLGWTALQRKAEQDIVFVVKDPAKMPVTMLWHSNGGRRFKPWSSRHTGVLGIEDGVSFGAAGHAASIGPNPMTAKNLPSCIELDPQGEVELSLVIGAFPWPEGWTKVASITNIGGNLVIEDRRKMAVSFPFLSDFLPRQG